MFRRSRFHHLICVFRRQDGCEIHAQVGNKGGLWLVQMEDHGVVIDLFDGLQQVRHVHAVEILILAAGNLVIGMLRIQLTREAVNHVFRVEIAARRKTVRRVKFHAFAEMERVGQTVLRHLPLFRERRNDLCGPTVEFDQSVEDLPRRSVEGRAGRIEGRIKALGAAFGTVNQSLGMTGAGETQDRRHGHAGQKRFLYHDDAPC